MLGMKMDVVSGRRGSVTLSKIHAQQLHDALQATIRYRKACDASAKANAQYASAMDESQESRLYIDAVIESTRLEYVAARDPWLAALQWVES